MRDGQGRVRVGDKIMTAHRLAYMLAAGAVPAGKKIKHRCDNLPCCNPKHLYVDYR